MKFFIKKVIKIIILGTSDFLTNSGPTLNDKIHSEMIESSNEFNSIFNQIWSRG